ncbi:MAG TPA: hypothetical protein DDX92_01720 [Flavobacteriales bacterium]|jgi:Ca-activated chloride channel family protein|nr:hypothetical protein [Flavobacteriales bacterium]
MFRFAHSEYLWGLLIWVLLLVIFLLRNRWNKKTVQELSSSKFRELIIPRYSVSARWGKFVVLSLAWFFLVIGLANPQIGSKLMEVKREGIDLIIAVDVSNSMQAEDIQPNRLERTKRGIEKLIDQLKGDRIGMVVFAGKAFVQLPLTTDYAAAKLFTSHLGTELINEQGTAIGAALELSMESFDSESETSKAIIVVTDGENHEDNAIEIAQEAVNQGIKIYTIGMGSAEGAPIPIYSSGRQIGYKKDRDGTTVVTRLNEKMLTELAEIGNGIFIRANSGNAGLKKILDSIEGMNKKEIESKIFSEYEDRYQYFISIALLLLIMEILLPEKRSKLRDRIKLFEKQ